MAIDLDYIVSHFGYIWTSTQSRTASHLKPPEQETNGHEALRGKVRDDDIDAAVLELTKDYLPDMESGMGRAHRARGCVARTT